MRWSRRPGQRLTGKKGCDMASKELRKLKRRELLKMLLVQCQETERLQQELKEITNTHETMMDSYERLKDKLNVKDERLNQKDVKIRELQNTIAEMKASREIELEEAGSIAEAALRLNGVFEAAQKAAEQYLINVRSLSEKYSDYPEDETDAEEKRIPIETGWRAGIRRRVTTSRSRTGASGSGDDRRGLTAVSGEAHG